MSTRPRWLWGLFLVVVMAVPLAMVVSIVFYVLVARSATPEAARDELARAVPTESLLREENRMARQHADLETPNAGMPAAPSMSGPSSISTDQSAKLQLLEHVVRIDVKFEGFREVRCAGLVVDRDTSGHVVIVAPASAFTPVTGKLNGRVVTRAAGPLIISRPSIADVPSMGGNSDAGMMGSAGMVGGAGGMAGGMGAGPAMMSGVGGAAAGAGMPGSGFGSLSFSGNTVKGNTQEVPRLARSGLVAFTFDEVCPPVRVLGEVPFVSTGDKLSCLSWDARLDTCVTVLATGVPSAEKSDAENLSADADLIRLSDAPVPMGSLLANDANRLVGMIVARRLADDGHTQHLYAAPMERVFEASVPFLEGASVADASTPAARGAPAKVAQDPEENRLETASRALAQRIRVSKEEQRPDLLTEFAELLDEHFDHRQQRRQLEIDELGGRLDKLRESHQNRQMNKADIIKRRQEALINPQTDRPWDEPH